MTDYTYFARRVGTEGPIKIGRSGDPVARLGCLSYECGIRMEMLAAVPFDCERQFHQYFRDWHEGREWFAWSAKMRRTIQHVLLGTFDFTKLPEARKVVGAGRHLKPHIGALVLTDKQVTA